MIHLVHFEEAAQEHPETVEARIRVVCAEWYALSPRAWLVVTDRDVSELRDLLGDGIPGAQVLVLSGSKIAWASKGFVPLAEWLMRAR